MPLSDNERERIVQSVIVDIASTLGPGHEAVVVETASDVASFVDEPVRFRDKLVEDIQQYFHDSFTNTTWPACPRHLNHPLSLRGEFWCCDRDDEAIAKLGELRSTSGRNAG